MSSRIRQFFSTTPLLAIMGFDVLLYNLGLILAFYVRQWGSPGEGALQAYEDLTTWVIGLPIVIFYGSGLYFVRWREATIPDFSRVIRALFLTTVSVLVVAYFFRSQKHILKFPTSVFLLSFAFGVFLVGGWRYLLRSLFQYFEVKSGLMRNLLIVGFQGLAPELLARIERNENPRFNIVGYVDVREKESEPVGEVKVLGRLDALENIIEREKVGEVLLVAEDMMYTDLVRAIRTCERMGVEYRVVPTFLHVMASQSRVDLINYVPVMRYGRARIEGWDALIKQLFDKSLALIFIALTLPVMLVSFVLIWLDSRGFPVFIQVRVGKDGRFFNIYKFRTMKKNAAAEGPLTSENDSRITRVGRVLRRVSIDELPQLFNVLMGQMSLVGPRAVVPYVADRFDELERMTLNVLPGITGLAQVSGRDELGFRGKSLLNIYYIRNYSIFLDLKILLKTVQVVLRGEGAQGTTRDWTV